MTAPNFSLATKSDKSTIKRFYKEQSYSARFIGHDFGYLLYREETIIGSALISTITAASTQALLHGLVVANGHQQRGLGSQLLDFALSQYQQLRQGPRTVIAFCQSDLLSFYQKHNFFVTDSNKLNRLLAPRYHSYQKKQSDLLIVCKSLSFD